MAFDIDDELPDRESGEIDSFRALTSLRLFSATILSEIRSERSDWQRSFLSRAQMCGERHRKGIRV